MRTFATAAGEAVVPLDRVQAGLGLGGEHGRDRARWRAAADSVGIDQVRSEPPWVGSSSTSTTLRPAAASTRWVVSRDR